MLHFLAAVHAVSKCLWVPVTWLHMHVSADTRGPAAQLPLTAPEGRGVWNGLDGGAGFSMGLSLCCLDSPSSLSLETEGAGAAAEPCLFPSKG